MFHVRTNIFSYKTKLRIYIECETRYKIYYLLRTSLKMCTRTNMVEGLARSDKDFCIATGKFQLMISIDVIDWLHPCNRSTDRPTMSREHVTKLSQEGINTRASNHQYTIIPRCSTTSDWNLLQGTIKVNIFYFYVYRIFS